MKFKSQVYTQASGSIGGITYSHNKGGMYTRARATPTNPNSTRQQAMRAAMGGMVNMWNALTDEQRMGWDLYASNVPVLNKLGDMINLSGQQMFNRTNTLRDGLTAMGAGLTAPAVFAAISDAPTTFNTGEPILSLDGVVNVADALTATMNLAAPASANGDGVLFMGRPQNPGVRFYKGPYQFATWIAVAAAATQVAFASDDVTDPADWASDYVPEIGYWIPLRARILYDDGRISQAWQDFALVTTEV